MGYIYHTVIVGLANPVDITAAVAVPEGQSPFADIVLRAATTNNMAVNLSARIIVNLALLNRNCGLTKEQLETKARSAVIYQIGESLDDTIKLTFYLYPVNIKYQSRLVHNDEVILSCELLKYYNASEADIPADLQAALEAFYLPADLGVVNPHWISNYAAPLSTGGVGPYLREYPGLLIESVEARERKERAICGYGTADGMKIYNYDLDVTRPVANSIRLGDIAENLIDGTYKVISFVKIGANTYALKSPDWDSLDYDTDYGAVSLGGIQRVGGGLVTPDYHLPRGLFGQYVVRSRTFYIGRCNKGDDWNAGAALDEYGYFQAVQVIGSAIPESDVQGYRIFQTTKESYGANASDWRERLFIGESVADIIETEELDHDPPVPSWWYFDADSIGWGGPDPEGPSNFRNNLIIPVRSYVTFEYESGIGGPMQKPPIRVFKRDRYLGWTNYLEDLEFRTSGPGPFDTFNYTYIGEIGEGIELKPGYYAFGAFGEPVITNRQTHPWKSGGQWGADSGYLQDAEHRIPPFRLTIEPVEYPIIIQKATEYDVNEIIALGSFKLTGDFDNYIDRGTDYWIFRISIHTGLISFLYQVNRDSYLIHETDKCVLLFYHISSTVWSIAGGNYPISAWIKITDFDRDIEKTIFKTMPKTPSAAAIMALLASGIYDYRITGLISDGADGYLIGIQKKIYAQKELPFEVRRISWFKYEPMDEGDYVGGERTGGFVRVRGDATDTLKSGDYIRLYVPPYERDILIWDPDLAIWIPYTYEQDRYSYPLKHRVVTVTYLPDENRTHIVIDPPPDRTSAYNPSYSVIENNSAIQFWDAIVSHKIPDDANAKPSIWKVDAERQWVSELWQVPKSAMDASDEDITDLVVQIAQATDTVTETLNLSWSDKYLGYSYELKETEIDITTVELSEDIQYSLKRGDNGKYNFITHEKKDNVEITYTYYSNMPYQFGANKIWQNGNIYEYNGSLNLVYGNSELPKSYLVGDPVELDNGNIVAPIYYDGKVRLIVIDLITANYGVAIRPIELSDNPQFTELLNIPKTFGLIADKEGLAWELKQMGNVVTTDYGIDTADILDAWEEDLWCDGIPIPRIRYGDNGKYPLAIGTGQTEIDVSNIFVNLNDAKAVYSKHEMLFNNDTPLYCYRVRLKPDTLNLIRNIGRMFDLDMYESGESIGNLNAILYSVDFKLNNGTAICKFVKIN